MSKKPAHLIDSAKTFLHGLTSSLSSPNIKLEVQDAKNLVENAWTLAQEFDNSVKETETATTEPPATT